MKPITRFKNAWKAETPKVWKAVRDLAITLSVSVPTIWATVSQIPNVELPSVVGKVVAYFTGACLLLISIAGTRKVKS